MKEYTLIGKNGQVVKLSGKNIFGIWCKKTSSSSFEAICLTFL
jgi:hypothetical protein